MEKKLKLTLIAFYTIASLGGIFFGYIISEVNQGKEIEKLATYQPTTPTRLYDINGIPFSELYRHKQELIQFRDIPPHVINAFLSVEDDNFYNHVGIDFIAIVRAAFVNVISGRIVQGGSTLTQQLAKTILQNRKKTLARKFLEALLTLQIEQEYTKDEILEIYFNLIYLGHGTTGISSAATVYFNKDVRDLDLVEAAILARLPKAPVKYSPFKNPDIAKRAHLEVLKAIAKNGFLKKEDVASLHEQFWKDYWSIVITQSPSRSTWGTRLQKAPYFTEWIRKDLEKRLGEETLYTGGLKVFTTLDIAKQEIAEEELVAALKKQDAIAFGASKGYNNRADKSLVDMYNFLGSIFPVVPPNITLLDPRQTFQLELTEILDPMDLLVNFSPVENEGSAVEEYKKLTQGYSQNLHVEGAFISLDHHNGHIVTMLGGSRFSPKNQFNRATQARRQTGSAFKPFVYGAAINDRAVGSGTGIMDAPLTTITEEGEGWSPQDISGDFRGMVPLTRALALSLNIVSVQVLMRTGIDSVIEFTSKLTKANPARFPRGPSLALGVAELTPLEMAVGYSIYANKGKDVRPIGIRYVQDQSGNMLWDNEKEVKAELSAKEQDGSIQIIPEATAFILRKMLIDTASYGSPSLGLRGEEYGNFKGDVAGKTGSTSSYSNAWFCGFDPRITSIVWLGFDKNTITLGQGQTAAYISAPIFGKIYKRWSQGKQVPKWADEYGVDTPPSEVVFGGVCSFNGMSPGENCPRSSNLFLKPIQIGGRYLSVPSSGNCDGDRDHFRSWDLKDFLQREYEISDEEAGVKKP